MQRFFQGLIFSAGLFSLGAAFADIIVPMNETNISAASVGSIAIRETQYGLLFIPNLHGLTPGIHGFHVHENPSCADSGNAAGGHLDPKKTNHHLGPYNDKGHLGDLPALYVNADGTATLPVLAPRLAQMKSIENHALMIHDGGDNYADEPMKLGGGGARMICGVIPGKP
jgi:Cu-Zn family superoxide dismutase